MTRSGLDFDWIRKMLPNQERLNGDPIGFLEALDCTPQELERLQRALEAPVRPSSEIADRGLLSRLGRALPWIDVATPSKSYQSVRIAVGQAVVLELAGAHGLADSGLQISPFLKRKAPVRHIAPGLARDLRDAPLVVWPTIRAVYPSGLIVMLPTGILTVADEPAAMLALEYDENEQLKLCANAWGFGGATASSGWSSHPDTPLTRLAWGITALLSSDPTVVELGPAAPTGMIRSRSKRPNATWITPPIRIVRTSPAAEPVSDRHGTVRGHWRMAHRHRFWTGPRGTSKRKLIDRWVGATWCGGDD